MPSNEIIPVSDAEVVDSVDGGNMLPNPASLTEQERKFCELYAVGIAPYAGNPAKCYEEAFGCDDPTSGMKAHMLLARSDVQRYLSEISDLDYEKAKYMKSYLNATLMHIMDEMAYCKGFTDRNGNITTPSSSRGVAVAAARLLMEINGLKGGSHDAELKIKNESGGNITFNVIVPAGAKQKEEIGQ
jgi:hypothetical protein